MGKAFLGVILIVGVLGFAFVQAVKPSREAVAVFAVAFVVALAAGAGRGR